MLKRCILRLSGLLLVLVTALAAAEEQPAPVNLSLKTAMAMAIRNNLDLRIDALDSSKAETIYLQSRGIYDPLLSLSGNHGQTFYTGQSYGTNDTSTFLGLTQYLPSGGNLSASTQTGYSTPESSFPDENWTDWYTSIGITVSQPLLKNFGKEATELNITLAANAHENSLQQFRLSVMETVYAVIKSYNRLYTLRQIDKSRQLALDNAKEILERLKTEGKQRQLQAVEIANTEYVISQRLKDLVEVERLINSQEAKLRYLIGMESSLDLIPIDPPSTEEPMETTDQAIALAMQERSDLKQLQLDLESSELQERVSRQRLLPNLAVSAGAGFRGIDDRFSDSVGQIMDGKGRWWTAGVQFSVPLGNTVAENDYRRSALKTSQLKYELSALEWKLRDYIEDDMRALLSARVQRQVAQRSQKIAELRVQQYRKSVKSKTSQVQDLLNAETDLIYARDTLTEAQETFANGVALLWKDAGVLLDRLNIHIDTRQPEEVSQLDQKSIVTDAAAPPPAQTGTLQPIPTGASPSRKTETAIASANFTLQVGEYVSSELEAVTQKVIDAGLAPRVGTGGKQARQVIRLKVGDYRTFKAAQAERIKIQDDVNSGVFILKNDKDSYSLFAGSYFNRNAALVEQKRLAALGIALTLEEASVRLPTSKVMAGNFSSRKAAVAASAKLKELGLNSIIVELKE